MEDERGQMLAIVLIAMIFGATVIAPFLLFASTALESSGRIGENNQAYYAADAGVEDAIWKARYGDLCPMGLDRPGASHSYVFSQSVNNFTPSVIITRTRTDIALEDFETGGAGAGTGWASGWSLSGDSSVVNVGTSHRGTYHLRLSSNNGYAERTVDLSGTSGLHLQFWAKVDSFEAAETASLKVGPAGSLATARTWTSADSDGIYRSYDIDLAPYAMASNFTIAFQAGMADAGDNFFVDDIQIVRVVPGAPGVLPGLPADDFETGGASGGYAWSAPWVLQGGASIGTSGGPQGGAYHLILPTGTPIVDRVADLSGLSDLRVQFCSKVAGFAGMNTATFQVSSDGLNWTTLKTWTRDDNDGTYHLNNFDLSPYAMSSTFRFRFQADILGANRALYIDNLRLVGPSLYEALATAGAYPLRSLIQLKASQVVVMSWVVDYGAA
ncbi:MAG TPA: hypothetical protein VJO15_08795, partial [Dehalococcoidia bacterium]|nr:hypothetical protein [Dehalococcoidia bacterium]